jgi:hypothetical protein
LHHENYFYHFRNLVHCIAILCHSRNYTTFKISDHLGRTMEVFVKTENIEENFEFNTREIFNELKSNCKADMIDLTPFIKPEMEVIEDHPVYIQN